jgi:hypothetical protein
MSSAQGTASPRAPRGKHQQPQQGPTAQVSQTNNARQGQRRPKGNRAPHSAHQAGASPSRQPANNADPILAASAVFSSEEARLPQGPRNPKKHIQSQPSVDRMFSPSGAQASLTDTESAAKPITATPAKNQGAYAGPTFHASPAPSALPIPKFLSRSVPAKTRIGPPTPPPEESSESGSSPSPLAGSPSRPPIAVPPRNEMSPLDLLFKADRAERANQFQGSPNANNFFNSVNTSRPQHYKQDSYGSLNAPFPIELDGDARSSHMSPPPQASPAGHRSVPDPHNVSQLKDVSQSPNNDVMQDLLSRLSMSQKKPQAATPPRPDVQGQSNAATRNQNPSPFQDGRSAARSASGPSTPTPPAQENPDFFYGNRNLSPLFKAAKGDTSKRNSGLRTEITADSPLIAQGMFQDFPSAPPQAMDPNTFSRNQPVGGNGVPTGPRRGSTPYVQPYREMPNNHRRTPGRPVPQQPRPDSYPSKTNASGPGFNPNRAGVNGAPASVKKPATSMMSFVPASVAAKKHSSSAPTITPIPAPAKAASPPDTLALEQNLKRLLNVKPVDGDPGAF